MNYPAESYGVSKTAGIEASFGEYDLKRLNVKIQERRVISKNGLIGATGRLSGRKSI